MVKIKDKEGYFKVYKFGLVDKGDIWKVYTSPYFLNGYTNEKENILGGGLFVEFLKSNGEIIEIGIEG